MIKTLAMFAAVACAVHATPVPRAEQSNITDIDVLQFALTLEHLENAFYSGALSNYSVQDFENAGFQSWVYGRFKQLAEHEATHVKFLESTIGENATKPCEYNFPHTDPRSFAALSMVLETVGGSAYLGAAQFLQNKTYLTAAGSILAVESRHSGWVSSSVLKQQPWNGAFDTPLPPSGAFSLAAQFIASCPSSNPPLPVQAHPALNVSSGAPAAGQDVSFAFDRSQVAGNATLSVAWLDGLNVTYSDLGAQGNTTVPGGFAGTVYAAVVSSREQAPSDANLVSGFAVLQFPFSSNVSN